MHQMHYMFGPVERITLYQRRRQNSAHKLLRNDGARNSDPSAEMMSRIRII